MLDEFRSKRKTLAAILSRIGIPTMQVSLMVADYADNKFGGRQDRKLSRASTPTSVGVLAVVEMQN